MPKTDFDQLKMLMYETLNKFNRYDSIYGRYSKEAKRSLDQLKILKEVHEEYKRKMKRRHSK